MLTSGVIQSVKEPTVSLGVVAVPKTNKDRQIICVHLRRMNKVVRTEEKNVLPTNDGILPKLAGAEVFSHLHATRAYH